MKSARKRRELHAPQLESKPAAPEQPTSRIAVEEISDGE
jgi:hypothetical protein